MGLLDLSSTSLCWGCKASWVGRGKGLDFVRLTGRKQFEQGDSSGAGRRSGQQKEDEDRLGARCLMHKGKDQGAWVCRLVASEGVGVGKRLS